MTDQHPRELDPREEQRLRDLLDDATADVHPHDGLDAIRSRTKGSPMSTRPWLLGAAAAVLATAATVTAVAVLGSGGTPQAGPGPAADPTTASESPAVSEPPDEPGDVETDAPDGPVAVEGAVPVYYPGDTGQGPRLYREFHPGIGGPAFDQAIADAVGRAPDDPDYRNPWPAGTGITGTVTDGQIRLALTGPDGVDLSARPTGMSRDEARIAVQQLVYTAQAALQTSTAVSFTIDGEPATTLLNVAVDEPLARGAEDQTLAQVWIIEPGEGATVEDGFEVTGVGSFFEANVAWELHQGGLDGPVVASNADAPVMAEECCTMAPYSFTVDLPGGLPAGDYTLRVHDEDMSGGEGFTPFEDTKTLTLTR
ncbi:MAG: Gmad2 immunoglobulin-like domain-containing protein [Nocardioides sp.]